MSFVTYIPRDKLFSNRSVRRTYPIDASEYITREEERQRIAVAKERIVYIIRHLEPSLAGRGLNHILRGHGPGTKVLAKFIDDKDDARRKSVVAQRNGTLDGGLMARGIKLRSPQDVKRRRSALFSVADIEIHPHEELPDHRVIERLVNQIRLDIIHDAIEEMKRDHEIEFVGGAWLLKVSTTDAQRLGGNDGKSNRVKRDERPHHGRPNRDRGRQIT